MDELPVALIGTLSGAILKTQFIGGAGQRSSQILMDAGSVPKFDPCCDSIHLTIDYCPLARPTKQLAGDSRLIATLPSDGTYRLELQDIAFKSPEPGWFRLKLGDLQFMEHVFPMAVSGSRQHPVEVYGSSSSTVDFQSCPRSRSNGTPSKSTGQSNRQHRWSACARESLQLALGNASDAGRLPGNQALELPAAINGRLAEPGETDEYQLAVAPETEITAELFADRWGNPWDGVIEAFDVSGKLLARGDDQPNTTDPVLELKVPPDTNTIRLRISASRAVATVIISTVSLSAKTTR